MRWKPKKSSSVTKLWSSVTLWRGGLGFSVSQPSYLPYFQCKTLELWEYPYCIRIYTQRISEGLILALLQGIHARCTKTRYHHLLSFLHILYCVQNPWLTTRSRSERNCKKWEITSAIIMWKGGCEGSVLLDVMMMMVSKSQLFFFVDNEIWP